MACTHCKADCGDRAFCNRTCWEACYCIPPKGVSSRDRVPWRVAVWEDPETGTAFEIEDAAGCVIASSNLFHSSGASGEKVPTEEEEADRQLAADHLRCVRLLVHAFNHHAELVEALQEACHLLRANRASTDRFDDLIARTTGKG